jgi:hypothetical protein
MTSKRPPRFAAFLVTRFADNEPLAGDLQEEYEAGRSRLWYWREAVIAAAVGQMRTHAVHDLLTPQSLFMQFVMLALVGLCATFSVKLIAMVVLDGTAWRVLFGADAGRALAQLLLSLAVAIPVGVVVARVHLRTRLGAVLALSAIVPFWAFLNMWLFDGGRNLDAALPHAVVVVVFICGVLRGAIDVDVMLRARQMRRV